MFIGYLTRVSCELNLRKRKSRLVEVGNHFMPRVNVEQSTKTGQRKNQRALRLLATSKVRVEYDNKFYPRCMFGRTLNVRMKNLTRIR